MKITKRQLQDIIREEKEAIEYDTPEEVEALDDVWAGGENLSDDVDHSKEAGGEAVTPEPEVLKITEGQLRNMIQSIMQELL